MLFVNNIVEIFKYLVNIYNAEEEDAKQTRWKKTETPNSYETTGGVIYTLTIEKSIFGNTSIDRGDNLIQLINKNISSPKNYMFRKETDTEYSAYAITFTRQQFNANGPTINTWNEMESNNYSYNNNNETYEEHFRKLGYMPYDEIIKNK